MLADGTGYNKGGDTMTDDELLFAISGMLDKKLQPLGHRIKRIEVDLLENKVLPRLNTLESCYASTSGRCKDSIEDYEA